MTNEEPSTSLWLVPAEPQRAELRAHIDHLALEHGTPSFEPHVTLASGVAAHAAVVTAIERVAAEWEPLDVRAGSTAHGPDRFKAVFVELDDARLHGLAAELCGELRFPFEHDQLQPHLSLLYAADLPLRTRAAITEAHSFAGTTLRFDTLMASVPGADIDDVARWQITVARQLTARS